MKRLIIAIVMLVVILSASGLAVVNLYDTKQAILHRTDELRAMADDPPREVLLEKSRELFDFWNEKEGTLVMYIHHDMLDHITQLLAELPALVEFEDYATFFGRLDVVNALMEDLWNSSLPTYRNLL